MTRARASALVALALVVAAAVAIELRPGSANLAPQSPSDRPTLLLLTSLPIVFGEDFSLKGGGSPALTALETRYRVVPVNSAASAELLKGKMLLMAHASAQTAENLVALDQWVRDGGRVLLLADPMLEWPSSRPLGDPLRPSPMFPDTGLLAHWGLRLDAPDQPGPQLRQIDGLHVLTDSPGTLVGKCQIVSAGLVADCRIEKGRAIVIADADFLNAERLGDEAKHNLDALLDELAKLERE